MARDMMTEEIYFRAAKLTLGQVEDQTVLVKTLKKGAEMITMLLHRSARDEDVIQVGKREVEATTPRPSAVERPAQSSSARKACAKTQTAQTV